MRVEFTALTKNIQGAGGYPWHFCFPVLLSVFSLTKLHNEYKDLLINPLKMMDCVQYIGGDIRKSLKKYKKSNDCSYRGGEEEHGYNYFVY